MIYERRTFTGYATTYTSVYASTSSWKNVNKAFDWKTTDTAFYGTDEYATVENVSAKDNSWNIKGIGTWKSFVDENWNDAYGGVGTEYTNFSFIPKAAKVHSLKFTAYRKSSRDDYGVFNRGGTPAILLSTDQSLIASMKMGSAASSSWREVALYFSRTWLDYPDLRDGTSTPHRTIGDWTVEDLQNGLFTADIIYPGGGTLSGTKSICIAGFKLDVEIDIPYYEVVANPGTLGGSVTASGSEFLVDTTATVTATPDSRYEFDYWLVNGVRVDTSTTSLTLSMTEDKDVQAIFKSKVGYVLYDTAVDYIRWKNSGISIVNANSLYNEIKISDTGFTIKSKRNSLVQTSESPRYRVKPNTEYTLSMDCTGGTLAVEIYYYKDNIFTSVPINSLSSTEPIVNFRTPEDCYYISLCIGTSASNTANPLTISNLLVYPAGCDYMKNTIGWSERSILDSWKFPDTVLNGGYVFYGWNTEPDGSGTFYDINSPYPKEDLTLYSHWRYPIFYKGVPAKYISRYGLIGSIVGTGRFLKNPLYLNVTFYNWDGSIHETVRTLYGHYPECSTTPTRPSDASYDYNFIGWDKEIVPCKQDTFYIAKYNKITK